MIDKIIWKGKGPIMYEIDLYGMDMNIEPGWKYQIWISGAGQYRDGYLGCDTEEFGIYADTKEGIIRDMALYITHQAPLDKDMQELRKEKGAPPQLLALSNVIIHDHTATGEFHDIDIPAIFANIDTLSNTLPPFGECLFIASINDGDSQGMYDIGISTVDPFVVEEFENGNFDTDMEYLNGIPSYDVNKTIKDALSEREWEEDDQKIKPNISNTKILNNTDNPEFTLNRIFATATPLKLMHARPSLQLTRKAPTVQIQSSIEIPVPPIAKKETISPTSTNIEKEQPIEKKRHVESNKKRLRA